MVPLDSYIPYGRQTIDDEDIAAVVEVLKSDWLTTGPKIDEFEQVFADSCNVKHAVAVSNGTAALHCAMYAADILPGDEVIVTPMTFAASANCILYMGATPVFADVNPNTLLVDPAEVKKKVTGKTKAIIAVDYAGQPCDYDALRNIARRNNLILVADACHSIGGSYKGQPVGSLADLNTFSFHPVKHMTTGEGGMITTDNADYAKTMRIFRNHGITTDHRERAKKGAWFYEMTELGFNYRITDFQCALGLSQLTKLKGWVDRRQDLARQYGAALEAVVGVMPLTMRAGVSHAYHLYVVRINGSQTGISRNTVFERMRNAGIGVNVHYVPVHLHPYYKNRYETAPGLCPTAERAYDEIISLPMYPGLEEADVSRIVEAVARNVEEH